MRYVIDLSGKWKFQLSDKKLTKGELLDDISWKEVNIPHDWSISGTFKKDRKEYRAKLQNQGHSVGYLIKNGIGWYRKQFTAPTEWKEYKVFIEFDGVYNECEVWINGHSVGTHQYGYTAFYFHIDKYLKWGEDNVVTVRVQNKQMNSRWYSGSGIYRNVKLIAKPQMNIGTWFTHITTPSISQSEAEIHINTEIHGGKTKSPDMSLVVAISDPAGNIVLTDRKPVTSTGKLSRVYSIKDPKLWSPTAPNLYTAILSLEPTDNPEDKVYSDQDVVNFGIRDFKFDPDKGFFLNGQSMKLKGVCNHHDLGCLGSAFNYRARQRQLEILKEMGCNAIRTSHNPVEPQMLDLCDEMGFLVMEEAFDCWWIKKRRNDYGKHFRKRWKKDLTAMVKRDRNHPSIIIWSVGNELIEQHFRAGTRMLKKLKALIHRFDSNRPITSGLNSMRDANKKGFSDALDLVGYNYFGNGMRFGAEKYDKDHIKYPKRIIYGSETSSSVRSRGIYHLPTGENKLKSEDLQCSSFDNCWVWWGSDAETSWKAVIDREFIAGEFIWTGFDYLGEPTPYDWPSKNSYFGIIDLCGFPKDIYYFYQSQWTKEPMLHLFPHWNWEKEDLTNGKVPVWCYTNCEKVELFLNGRSLGKRTYADTENLHLEWMVDYEPGELTAKGTTADNRVLEQKIRTASTPKQIRLIADRSEIIADGKDLSFITVEILDGNGTLVPNAENLVEFSLEGPAHIVGVDNGNSISHEPFQAHYRKTFSSKCLCVIQSQKSAGKISLKATSKGLDSTEIDINSK